MEIQTFLQERPLQERMQQSYRIKMKFPDRIPIFIDRKNDKVPFFEKTKFLIPKDLSFGQLIYILRRQMYLSPEKALFLFIYEKNILPSCSTLMYQIYAEYMSEDGFLYLICTEENTFG